MMTHDRYPNQVDIAEETRLLRLFQHEGSCLEQISDRRLVSKCHRQLHPAADKPIASQPHTPLTGTDVMKDRRMDADRTRTNPRDCRLIVGPQPWIETVYFTHRSTAPSRPTICGQGLVRPSHCRRRLPSVPSKAYSISGWRTHKSGRGGSRPVVRHRPASCATDPAAESKSLLRPASGPTSSDSLTQLPGFARLAAERPK